MILEWPKLPGDDDATNKGLASFSPQILSTKDDSNEAVRPSARWCWPRLMVTTECLGHEAGASHLFRAGQVTNARLKNHREEELRPKIVSNVAYH
jgi:hypothetical protein